MSATTRDVRGAYEFYAITMEGKGPFQALAEFGEWLDGIERAAVEAHRASARMDAELRRTFPEPS